MVCQIYFRRYYYLYYILIRMNIFGQFKKKMKIFHSAETLRLFLFFICSPGSKYGPILSFSEVYSLGIYQREFYLNLILHLQNWTSSGPQPCSMTF